MGEMSFSSQEARYFPIFSFLSHKGGVGKTTNCFHIASGVPFCLMDGLSSSRVLFIDLDESGDGTRYFLPDYNGKKEYLEEHDLKTLADFLSCEPTVENLLSCIRSLGGDGMSFIPSAPYSEIEGILNSDPLCLRERLHILSGYFDVCFIDSPPTRGWFQHIAMLTSDYVMVCSDISYGGLQGITDALADISDINRRYKRNIEVPGILVQSLPSIRSTSEAYRAFSESKGSSWFDSELSKITDISPIYLPWDRTLLLLVRQEGDYIYHYSKKKLAEVYAAIAVWLVENYIENGELQYPAYRPFEKAYSNFKK